MAYIRLWLLWVFVIALGMAKNVPFLWCKNGVYLWRRVELSSAVRRRNNDDEAEILTLEYYSETPDYHFLPLTHVVKNVMSQLNTSNVGGRGQRHRESWVTTSNCRKFWLNGPRYLFPNRMHAVQINVIEKIANFWAADFNGMKSEYRITHN